MKLSSPVFREISFQLSCLRNLLEDSSEVLGSLVSVDRGSDGLYILVLDVGHEPLEHGDNSSWGNLLLSLSSLLLGVGLLLGCICFLSLVLLERSERRDGVWVGSKQVLGLGSWGLRLSWGWDRLDEGSRLEFGALDLDLVVAEGVGGLSLVVLVGVEALVLVS